MEQACFKRDCRAFERRLLNLVRAYRNALIFYVAAAVSVSAALSGCAQDKKVRGQLIVTFQTDMALPAQIDTVLVQVTRSSGQVVHMVEYPLGGSRNDKSVPGTFALVAGESREPVTITVAGRKDETWRTYREAVTTVPQDRVAELRMPIQWLCNESAQPQYKSLPDGKGGIVSRVVQNCANGMTCKAGTCESSDLDSETLPDYKPAQVFGGADEAKQGSCFDVMECMAAGNTVEPDANCTIAMAGDNLNVSLRVAGGGICNKTGPATTCFVPLDGNDREGWTVTPDGTRIQLPKEVCKRIATHQVLAVQVSTACRTKDPSLPPCGDWSSVPDDRAIVPEASAMVPTWPSPEVLAMLSIDEKNKLACPLMSDEGSLYTCTRSTDGTNATVYEIDAQTGRSNTFELDVQPTMAAAVFNQTLYWAGNDDLFQFPLQAGAKPKQSRGRGGLYTDGVLLADEGGIHALTSGVGMDMGNTSNVVQLLHFSLNGEVSGMDPLGNTVVKPIAQDASAFYAGLNMDDKQPDGTPYPDGTPFKRVSSVVRIDKKSHQVSTLLNARTMTISSIKFNGYLGVVSDGSDVFALFESEPVAGFEQLQIGRVSNAATAGASDFMPIYDLSVSADKHLTRLRLLGAIEGSVFFARDEWVQADEGEPSLRSSSVMVIPHGSTSARFIADFTNDAPAAGVFASGQQVFWLNQLGRVFALSREALAP